MEYRPCPTPFQNYEISNHGHMRRKTGNGQHYLRPWAKKGVPYYSSHVDGKNAAQRVEGLMEVVWPEMAFKPSKQWFEDMRREAATMSFKGKEFRTKKADQPRKKPRPEKHLSGSYLPESDGQYCGRMNWNDANYCPMG